MAVRKKPTVKLQDTNAEITGSGSRLEKYWQANGIQNFFGKFRNKPVPQKFRDSSDLSRIVKTWHLRAIGFGNWVTQEDRNNYLSALLLALYDLNKVLRFNQNIGLNGILSVTFGSRGAGSALGHFEPWSFIINLTRYHENPKFWSKERRFLLTGGSGVMAHEYGHALDYYFGLIVDPSFLSGALTGGRSVSRTYQSKGTDKLRILMDALMNKLIWKKYGDTLSPFYLRVLKNTSNDYWVQRNEIFARSFELYIKMKLNSLGIKNKFLTVTKYEESVYPRESEMTQVIPLFDKLIAEMRRELARPLTAAKTRRALS